MGEKLICHIFIKFFSVGWNLFYPLNVPNYVGEVLTLLLHDVILNFISVWKTAKVETSATKEKGKFVPISVGENSFLLLHDITLRIVSISKTAKTEVSAINGGKVNMPYIYQIFFCRVEFILPGLRTVSKLKTAKVKTSDTKEKRRFVPISVGENSFLLLHDIALSIVAISKTTKIKVSSTKEYE